MPLSDDVRAIPWRYADKFKQLNGPGDQRPSAQQIVQDERLEGKLEDLVVLITGATSGIGIETARALYETGAQIYITARNKTKAAEVINDIVDNSKFKNKHPIKVIELELDDLSSIRKGAQQLLSQCSQLNILINNAGIMASPQGQTKDGFEVQFGTNHLGHFYLFQLLKDALIKSSTNQFQSRVISLSSIAHRYSGIHFDDIDFKKQGYDKWVAYGQAKTANVYFANELERRYATKGLHGLSVHPGGILTNLTRHLEESEVQGMTQNSQLYKTFKNPAQGAATTVYAAISKDFEGKGGLYLEDCSVSQPFQGEDAMDLVKPGYAQHAYNAEHEHKLWQFSCKLVGVTALD